MKYSIVGRPAYSMLKVFLEGEESITAESGSMVAMEGDVKVDTKSRGILKAITTKESLFLNADKSIGNSSIWFAPPVPGDIRYMGVKDKALILSSSCYLAHHGDIKQQTVWKGLKGVFGGGGLI